ncbi:MAG: ABC transporter ATP-binding protein [Pseudopedobacter saltans]|uniref:ABC transporter ATP-binding protein n=1 Tax=Pseudopedobacter saltans TaxID=151895 RepID=A0A2W5F2X5_9SPHI|nr:MAG: ABC transporter ATP-binding protein [Pseudopedobacter saltans]
MLEADGIEYQIKGKKILSNIYLKAEKGEVTGIIGRNGCGKTTLMNVIFGSLKADYASIRIDGQKLKKGINPEQIQYLPQFTILPDNLSLERIAKLYNIDFSEFAQYFKLKVPENARFGELSKGSQRLLECYIFLKNPCEVTLLDEPFSFIMPIYVEKIKQLINYQKPNKTIIITDHMFRHVNEVCDKLFLIKNGRTIPIKQQNDLIQNGYLPDNYFD